MQRGGGERISLRGENVQDILGNPIGAKVNRGEDERCSWEVQVKESTGQLSYASVRCTRLRATFWK